jgi:hypothetical protein
VLMFVNARTINNHTSFCQIFLYPSRSSSSSPMENFNAEWGEKVVGPFQTHDDPQPQSEKPDKGWTPVTGHVNIKVGNDINYTCILVAASGHGRVMSIIITLAGQDFTADAKKFLEEMDLDVRTVASGRRDDGGSLQQGSMADYIYSVPPGWTPKQFPDGIVLAPPVSNTGEKCNIILWPMRTATDNLQHDAIGVFNEVFKGWIGKNGDTQNSIVRGRSVQGWDYFIIKADITKPGGNYTPQFGFVFVARIGNRLAAISGMSKDPLVSACFGLNLTDVWPKFFYSLRFNGWGSAMPDGEIMKRMAGVWMTATATVGDRWVFAPNGRYASAAAAQRYSVVSSSEVLRTTDAYFGNGSYSLKGNNIYFTGDEDKGNPKRGLFRLEEESKDNGNTWVKKLYILRVSSVDGSEYEVGYKFQQ